ncbi:PhoH family protein [Euzebya sp.]|uniref:PhoH family protein n=1 Tax=Euzebya sp. TaxID=1971409 RepID=UPI003518A353
MRTYVLDTSVLLAVGAKALTAFDEHAVVLPVVVLEELEAKRHHPDLGYAAREVLRALEDLRVVHGTLTEPLAVNDLGGTVRVELNHQDGSGLPESLRGTSNDHRILAVARNLSDEGLAVTLVTKDIPLRLRASIAGVAAEEYRSEQVVARAWSGMVDLEVPGVVINTLYRQMGIEVADLAGYADLPINAGVVMTAGSQSALARVHPDKVVRPLISEVHLNGVTGRSAEQKIALALLADPEVGIVSLGGNAGTGKSVLALAAGLHAVLKQRTHRRVIVFRPLYAVGGQDLGFLPGTALEKMQPWGDAVHDALESISDGDMANVLKSKGALEVLPLTHIRGRNLTDTFVIIDEAQNLERSVLLTALSRLGEGSRAVLTHDIAQRDNLRVGRHDGIASVVASLRGHPLFGHISLTKSERSPISALIGELLDDQLGG